MAYCTRPAHTAGAWSLSTGWFEQTVSKHYGTLCSAYAKSEGTRAARGLRGRRSIAQRCRLRASDLALDGVPRALEHRDGGFRALEHARAARAITYHNENGLLLDSEMEGAAPRNRRFRALTVHVYSVHRAPKGCLNRQSPESRCAFLALRTPHLLFLPSPVPAVSRPLSPSGSCIRPRRLHLPPAQHTIYDICR